MGTEHSGASAELGLGQGLQSGSLSPFPASSWHGHDGLALTPVFRWNRECLVDRLPFSSMLPPRVRHGLTKDEEEGAGGETAF